MNLKLEVYLHVDEDHWGPDEVARLTINLGDLIVALGYGNVGAPGDEVPTLKSVIAVKPADEKITEKWWDKLAKDAMAINMPSDDERFVQQARDGGIPGA